MEDRSTRLEPEALLAHAGWLRQLAASLVGDPGTADDVVQDTWLAALRHPPALDRPLAPWLARVARNFAFRRRRSERRRAEHELASGSSGDAPTPAETIERLALQRALVEAVLAIDEPFRTAIVQRYFEGYSAAEIARALGVPAGTVRWRLKRGLAELRERLDARFGSRASWCVWLVPLARPSSGADPRAGAPPAAASEVLTGVLAMSATQMVAVVAGLAVVVGAVWWGLDGRDGDPVGAVVALAPTEPAVLVETPSAEEPALVTREPREAVALATETEAEPSVAVGGAVQATTAVEARFVDSAGVPWSGVRLEAFDEQRPPNPWGEPTLSTGDGRTRMEFVFPDRRNEGVPVRSRRLALVASRSGLTTVKRSAVVHAGETAHLGDVVLGPGVRLTGRILDDQGHGVPHATVGTTVAELPPEEDGRLRRHGSPAFDVPVTMSAEDGAFVLDGVGAGTWRLWSHALGTRYAWSEPIAVTAERDLFGLELVLTPLLVTDRIEGRIVDPRGEPFRASLMSRVHDPRHGGFGRGEHVDEQGRFVLVIEHDGEIWDLTARDFSERFATTTIEGVRPGTLDLVLRMPEKAFMDVRVHDAENQTVDDATFLLGVGGGWSDPGVEASAPGHYRVSVPDAVFRLEVSAPGFRTETHGRFDPASLPSPLEVVLRRAPVVRGHVITEGRAVAGARVELRQDDPEALETVDGFRCVMWALTEIEGTTDAGGRFELACDLDGAFWMRVTAPGLAPTAIGPIDAGQLAVTADFEVVLTEGGALEGHVLLPDGADAEGTIVAINHGDGAPRTMRAGSGGSFRFEHLATGKWQVLASEVEVDAQRCIFASLGEAEPIEWSCEVSAGRITRYDLDLRSK